MKICEDEFISTKLEDVFFSKWEFELSSFQKWSIRALLNNKHALITAHTGSGKTVPAEAAILHFTGMGKRVIYTSPIKALTNQKFNEFTRKFPNISFGILTGDNKFNPEAQVLLMTAEIYRNTLFKKKMIECGDNVQKDLLSFEIDIDTELGCVIIDEAHYINNIDRGRVWEEKIILTPPNIPMLLLSATISQPEKLASFIERRGGPEVFICSTDKRVVPLTHYGYITIPESYIKNMKQPDVEKYNSFNKFITLKYSDDVGGKFNELGYDKLLKIYKFINVNKIRVNRNFVLNNLIEKVKNNKLLPAIIFVFSRKQVDELASKIQIPLFEEDSKIPYTIEKECEKLLRSKLSNWMDYTKLSEYTRIVNLLKKGIAVHHAGILKEFREMIELLFEKKYIKLLFATETFAVGINMPTKTTIFTSLEKFDGTKFRPLEPSEYTQMAGRAGRRGLDLKGTVIHANNLISRNDLTTRDYKNILTGAPKSISSKFEIHPNLLLHLISSGNNNIGTFINKSIIQKEIETDVSCIENEITELTSTLKTKKSFKTDITILEKLHSMELEMKNTKPKRRKKLDREFNNIIDMERYAKNDYNKYKDYLSLLDDEKRLLTRKKYTSSWVKNCCDTQTKLLMDWDFLSDETILTNKGKYSLCFQEVFSLPFGEALNNNIFDSLTPIEIVSCISCFTHIRLTDDNTVMSLNEDKLGENIINTIKTIENLYNKYNDLFDRNDIKNIECSEIQYNLCEIMLSWCNATDETACVKIINECKMYDIGLGDFVKAVLKINNICKELENQCIISENTEFLQKLKCIPDLTLKHCVSNQSLYL
jgi:superfamily II RNA helicase